MGKKTRENVETQTVASSQMNSTKIPYMEKCWHESKHRKCHNQMTEN